MFHDSLPPNCLLYPSSCIQGVCVCVSVYAYSYQCSNLWYQFRWYLKSNRIVTTHLDALFWYIGRPQNSFVLLFCGIEDIMCVPNRWHFFIHPCTSLQNTLVIMRMEYKSLAHFGQLFYILCLWKPLASS